jgi:Family of unknown function (DUF6065)
MYRIMRSLSSEIAISFHALEQRNSDHSGRKSKSIRPESADGQPPRNLHDPPRPLPPSRGEAVSFNHGKPNYVPLEGVIETWWLSYTFTLNWKLVEPGTVEFRQDKRPGQLAPLPHLTFQGATAT